MTVGEPRWLTTDEVLDIHRRTLAAHGGLDGVRDAVGLEVAVFRPQQYFAYEDECDVFVFAALYAVAIMAHWPCPEFVDTGLMWFESDQRASVTSTVSTL